MSTTVVVAIVTEAQTSLPLVPFLCEACNLRERRVVETGERKAGNLQ